MNYFIFNFTFNIHFVASNRFIINGEFSTRGFLNFKPSIAE